MIDADQPAMSSTKEPIEAVVTHLRGDDDVVRCAAAKALGQLGHQAGAPALIEALLDTDPDVRTDAMEALITCARPIDAAAILQSLEGDPVKEVKVFAIRALARLEDPAALPLIRRLAKDRAEDAVTWEDDAGMWDDWLDVQIAAIEALGRMQAGEAIDDLLEARTDEMGQELDDVIFPTLAEIEDGGITALLGLLRDRDPKVRERAVKAMARARPETLSPMRDLLLRDNSPVLRRLAIPALDPGSAAATDLVLHDADAGVRRAALETFGHQRADLVEAAITDADDEVRATALKAIATGDGRPLPPDLTDNVQAWMTVAKTPLAVAAAAVLPKLAGERAIPPLCRLAEDAERPVEVRIAALEALGHSTGDRLVEALQRSVIDPTSQIRAAALGSLAKLARQPDSDHGRAAEAALAAAIRGDLGADARAHPPLAKERDDLGASKVEGEQDRISITPEGDIVTDDPDDDTVVEGHFPRSTLDAIQTIDMRVDEQQSDLSADQSKPTKRRVPVDGPADVAADIRRVALAMSADCPSEQVGHAVITALWDREPTVRAAAFRTLAQRSMVVEGSALEKIDDALHDPDAAIRHDAACILINASPDDLDIRLSILLEDEDAMVRGVAIGRLGGRQPAIALKALEDKSNLVRRAALDGLIEAGHVAALRDGVQVCLAAGHADTLVDGLKRCSNLREPLLSRLGDEKLSRLEILTALNALASA